jgi:hypothetical protein
VIKLVLMLRLVFYLVLRQAEGFVGSVLRLLELNLNIPSHIPLEPAQPRRGWEAR